MQISLFYTCRVDSSDKVTRMIRKAEAQYWKKQFKEAQEPNNFWKLVNKIKGKKQMQE